ncbi:hypothetical protein ACHAWC_005051 [Mediolabrus comicus]
MWFDALSKENNDATVKNNAKKAVKQKPPASLLSSTAAAVPSPGLPPIHFMSRRSPIYCTKACVATSQPLATSIGLHILRELGGNAADASVGVAAALAVLEPCSTGLGGDMFALWYDANTQKVKSINGSGRCPANLTLDVVKSCHKSELDFSMGINSITVPGAARGWEDTITKFGSGKLTLLQILDPAIKLADEGFPVSTLTAMRWTQQMDCITKWYSPDEIDEGRVEMSIDGRGMAPKPGQLFHNPHMAKVLRSLGEYGAQEGFYNGFPGRSIVETICKHGGVMTMEDLTTHASTYPDPIQMLHAQIEMMRLGFGDARSYVCDPCFLSSSSETEWLLDGERISKRALKLFDSHKAVIQGKPTPSSCTVSFQVVDELGNAMSFVNSNYMGFGTGLTPHDCGFTLQNRGAGFSLDPTHPNVLAPHKRPYHTIIPAMLTYSDTGELYASLSNMGGFMQPQGHLQLVVQLVKNGLDPQTAVDAPRFCIIDGTQNGKVYVETGFKEETVEKLAKLGHDMEADVSGHEREIFGRAQIITRDRETGVLCAASDGRADGCALGY